jgi:DNA-binding CsgD family transcriptional regulator
MYYEQGDKQGMAECLEGLAAVEVQGQEERAMKLFGAAESIRERIGSPQPPADREMYKQGLDEARNVLGSEAYEAAFHIGRLMTPDEAVRLALQPVEVQEQDRRKEAGRNYELTRRETEVLRLVAGGLSDQEIARKLSLSPRTVQAHLQSIYNKLEVSNRSAAGRFAVEHELI